MDANTKLIKDIMQNNEISEYVSIEETALPDEYKQPVEVVPEGTLRVSNSAKVNKLQLAYMYMQGYDTRTLAEQFECTENTIREIRASTEFKQLLGLLNHEIVSTARTFLTAAGLKAVKTLLTCMDSHDDRTKLKASTEVLDRIGLKAPEQLEIINKGDVIGKMSEDQLMEVIKLGMKEIMPITKGE